MVTCLVEYFPTTQPIYDVDLAAPTADRWKRLSRADGENIAAMIDDVVEERLDYASWPPGVPTVDREVAGERGDQAGWVVDWIASLFGQGSVAEIRGIARHAKLPLEHVVLGNLIYDICQIGSIPDVGFSSYSVTTDGKPWLARYMDWVFLATLHIPSSAISVSSSHGGTTTHRQ